MAQPPPLYPFWNDSQENLLRKITSNLAHLIENGGGPGSVDTVTGTANQITVTPNTGNVVVSLPTAIVGVNSLTAGGSNTLTLATGAGNANIVLAPHGTGIVSSGPIVATSINNTPIGAGTPSTVAATTLTAGEGTGLSGLFGSLVGLGNLGGFPTIASSQGTAYGNATLGLVLAGSGSTNSVTITNSAGSTIAAFSSSTGLAVTGTISTTAAVAWNLGAANVVSPTSPNRTLTVTVAGTTYYIAAKLTND